MDLKNKTALVTGCAVRLGRAISLELSSAGCAIIGHYHSSREEALSLKREVTGNGGQIELLPADLSDAEERQAFILKVQALPREPDILVNSAAIFFPTPLASASEEEWERLMDINLKPLFFLARTFGLQMKKRGAGRIINIGDTAWRAPWADYIPYLITKGGVNTLTRGLARALAPNVLVNCINPGPVLMPGDYSPAQIEKALERTLLQREGSAEDIARAVRFLAEADYITGASIPVDGGRHIG